MPLKIKKIKRELKRGLSKVGKDANGEYKHIPPQFLARDTNKYPTLPVLAKEIIPRPGLGAVTFRSIVNSEKSNDSYRVTVQFMGMKFNNAQSPAFPMTAKLKDVDIFFNVPSINKNAVMCRCSCKDFQHRFSHQMMKNKSLIGAPRKYKRLTPEWPKGYPKVNVTDKIGYCKHVHSLLANLRDSAQLKER